MLGVEERAYSSWNTWVTIALRDKLSPGTHLVFQGYDFAIPDGQRICGYGPWLKPTFDLHKFPLGVGRQEMVCPGGEGTSKFRCVVFDLPS
jgi:hypothetical protein